MRSAVENRSSPRDRPSPQKTNWQQQQQQKKSSSNFSADSLTCFFVYEQRPLSPPLVFLLRDAESKALVKVQRARVCSNSSQWDVLLRLRAQPTGVPPLSGAFSLGVGGGMGGGWWANSSLPPPPQSPQHTPNYNTLIINVKLSSFNDLLKVATLPRFTKKFFTSKKIKIT